MAPRPQILTTIVTTAPAFPLMMAANLPSFAVRGQPLVGRVLGVNGAGGYSYAKTAGPAFFTVNSATGDCTGTTPSGQASFDVTISTTDALAATVSHTYHITTGYTIEPPGGWTTSNTKTPNAITGQPYQFDVSKLLVSPVLPVTYSVSTGSAPTGIAFPTSTNPVLTATSVSGSTQSFSVTATDSASNVTIIPLTITVGPALSLAITTMPQAVIGQPYYAKITASGGTGVYSYDVSPALAQLPAWATLNQKTGEITGTPNTLTPTSGPQLIRFRVTDSNGIAATASSTLPVGSAVTPAPKGRFITTDSSGSPQAIDFFAAYFGDGSDGDLVLDGTNAYAGLYTKVGFVYTQLRPIYANNITIGTGVTVNTRGIPTFVRGNTDRTAANTHITANGGNTTTTAGGIGINSAFFGQIGVGGVGATAVNGAGVAGGVPTPSGQMNNQIGVAGAGGNSGAGGGGAGAPGGAPQTGNAAVSTTTFPLRMPFMPFTWGFGCIAGGLGGGAGAAGAGSGAAPGGNGGGGGGPGSVLYWFTYTYTCSANAATWGAVGGDAADGAAAVSGRGNGGGGGGASGGLIWIVCVFYEGTTGSNTADVSGGDGGNKGSGAGGAAADGVGASSGFAFFYELSNNTSASVGIVSASGRLGGVAVLTF